MGVNPNEKDKSIEFVKKYSKNVLLGVKLEKEAMYYRTMYEVQESKLNRRLYSGRLKEMSVDNVKKI